MKDHISDQIVNALRADGWKHAGRIDQIEYRKRIPGFAPAGTISDGTRLVRLTICPAGRYLERVDGWGNVEKDVDLRVWKNDPEGAIRRVLGN